MKLEIKRAGPHDEAYQRAAIFVNGREAGHLALTQEEFQRFAALVKLQQGFFPRVVEVGRLIEIAVGTR